MTKPVDPRELTVEQVLALPAPLPPKPAPRRLTLRRALALGAAILVLAGSAGYGRYYWTTGRFQVSTDDAYVQADSTIVAPKVSGYLSQVLVADNQPVTAGALLAVIDDRDYAAALDQATADVATARAEIANAKASLDQQQAIIDQARATVAVDQATLTYAEQDYARYNDLANKGAGSLQMAQQTLSKRDTARAALTRDSAALTAAQRQVEVLQAQLAKANADLQHSQAVEEQARLNLGYTKIVAPIDGVVGNRSLRVGQFVQAGTQLLAVVPLASTYVVANFEETQLAGIRPGQPVGIDVDTYSGTTVKGRVDSIAPASGQQFALLPPDNATGNFTKIVQRIPVRIAIEANDPLRGDLRPGMSVTATIDTKAPAAGGAQPAAPTQSIASK
jgi:membrane fusion protein, multidrug efflux system